MHIAGGRLRGAYLMTRHLGESSHAAGRNLEAVGHYDEALAFFAEFPRERYHRARILNHRSRALMALNRVEDAVDAAQRALAETDGIGAPNEEAISHMLLADLAVDGTEEQRHLDAAAALIDQVEGREAEQIRRRLAV
jgi:tetratricopeptide (TPR) repeat protein